MNRLPLEVLHIICARLHPKDLAAVRLVNHVLASIAAHYLVDKIRFHTSPTSLDRLQKIAETQHFRTTIRTLEYEGCTLGDVGCVHAYMSHFEDEDHPSLERPRFPGPRATAREVRLFHRNKGKFEQEVAKKYAEYRQLYTAQQDLLNPDALSRLVGDSIARMPNVNLIRFTARRKCPHTCSQRFQEEFGKSCINPMTADSNVSTIQLQPLLFPAGQIMPNLRSIELEDISPQIFSGKAKKEQLIRVFQQLTQVVLVLKLSAHDIDDLDESSASAFKRHLSKGILRDCLASARALKDLDLSFICLSPCFVDLKYIITDAVWPEVTRLRLESVQASRDCFMDLFKRQQKLKNLEVLFLNLTSGYWPAMVDQMRAELSLRIFLPDGFLQDSSDLWPMDFLHAPTYINDADMITLGEHVGDYVCGKTIWDPTDNPLKEDFQDFADENFLRDEFGDPDDFSVMNDIEDDTEVDTMDEDDSENYSSMDEDTSARIILW